VTDQPLGSAPATTTARRRGAALGLALTVSVPLSAGSAAAPGFGQRDDLPVPLWLWVAGAAEAVVLSFGVIAGGRSTQGSAGEEDRGRARQDRGGPGADERSGRRGPHRVSSGKGQDRNTDGDGPVGRARGRRSATTVRAPSTVAS